MKAEQDTTKASGGGTAREVIETRTSRFWLGEDGILREVVLPGTEIALADAEEDVEAIGRICGGRRVPMLADGRGIRSATREARQCYSGKEAAQTVLAMGLLVASPLSRLIGNFFLRLNKPSFPMRLFTSEVDALKWLKGFIE